MKTNTLKGPASLSLGLGLALAAMVGTTSLPVQAQLPDITSDYTIQTIEAPGPSTGISGFFVNQAGVIAIQYGNAILAGQQVVVVWEKGAWNVVDVPGATSIGCGNVNSSGDIDIAYIGSDGNWHGAIYHKGALTYLPDWPPPYQGPRQGFLQLINDHDIMTAVAFDDPSVLFPWGWPVTHGVLLDESLSLFKVFDYPGAVVTIPYGLNNSLQIVGGYDHPDGVPHAFFSEGGYTFLDIEPPGSAWSFGCGINNQGESCGIYGVAGGPEEGYLLHKGQFSTFMVPGSSWTDLDYITDNGQLAGYYADQSGNQHAFIATPKPGRK